MDIAEVVRTISFTPRQIYEIVRPSANTAHGIDADAVRAQWQRAKPLFEQRQELTQRIAVQPPLACIGSRCSTARDLQSPTT